MKLVDVLICLEGHKEANSNYSFMSATHSLYYFRPKTDQDIDKFSKKIIMLFL
jgi:hypothetical protein